MWVGALWTLLVGLAAANNDDYHESLNLRPLPNNMLLAEFNFHARQPDIVPSEPQYTFFPRSLGQVLDRTNTQEVHIRFSQGWWDSETWGVEPGNGSAAGGIGVELWAWVGGADLEEARKNWKKLVNSLSGFFCASLNFIDDTQTAYPRSLLSSANDPPAKGWLMRGALPGEPVCTENLTPFMKLLPCKSWSGIGSLLDGHSLFDSQWQTMAVDVEHRNGQLVLVQSISTVLDVPRLLSRRKSPLPTPLPPDELSCDTSKPWHDKHVCLPKQPQTANWSLEEIFGHRIRGACPLASSSKITIEGDWTVLKNGAEKVPHVFELTGDESFDLTLVTDSVKDVPKPHSPQVLVDRSFTGTGQQRGGVRTVLTNNQNSTLRLRYFETLPWYMRVYLSTLSDPANIVQDLVYVGSQYRGRPTQIELIVELPPLSKSAVEYQFDKSLVFMEEYPPDANHGFEIPPGLLVTDDGYITRTTSLLLSLPVPDFSMPFNVIILTSTVMALAFGNILSLLVKYVVPESLGETAIPPLKERLKQKLARLLGSS